MPAVIWMAFVKSAAASPPRALYNLGHLPGLTNPHVASYNTPYGYPCILMIRMSSPASLRRLRHIPVVAASDTVLSMSTRSPCSNQAHFLPSGTGSQGRVRPLHYSAALWGSAWSPKPGAPIPEPTV
ncbi:hypothetical protein HDV57DRAFT_488246 [Trichoderma longibrachiatum]